jgi:hypothetical protein
VICDKSVKKGFPRKNGGLWRRGSLRVAKR